MIDELPLRICGEAIFFAVIGDAGGNYFRCSLCASALLSSDVIYTIKKMPGHIICLINWGWVRYEPGRKEYGYDL